MSIRLMTHIWDHGPQQISERIVLLALADFANDEGLCWPSMARISQRALLTRRALQRVISRLEANGWLTVQRNRGRGNVNLFTVHESLKSLGDGGTAHKESAGKAHDSAVLPDTKKATWAKGKATSETENASPGSPRTTTDPPMDSERGARARAFDRFWEKWPDAIGSDKLKAELAFDTLSPKEWQQAIDGIMPAHKALRAMGRTKLPAAATFLAQRKWEEIDGQSEPTNGPRTAKPFARLWWAGVFDLARRHEARRLRLCLSLAKDHTGMTVSVEDPVGRSVIEAEHQFRWVTAHNPEGQAWLRWLEDQVLYLRAGQLPPRYRADLTESTDQAPISIYVPGADLCAAWDLTNVAASAVVQVRTR